MTGVSYQDTGDESPYNAPCVAASKGGSEKRLAALWSLKVIFLFSLPTRSLMDHRCFCWTIAAVSAPANDSGF